MEEENFDYQCMPGKTVKNKGILKPKEPVITIVTSYYNSGIYIEQTANSIFNQTFPYWEWIIVDDGSTEEKSLQILEAIAQKHENIRVLHKENGGTAAARDYGAKYAREETKYLMFLDEDDLIDPTYLECAYWTLETHPEASWAYTDVVNFGEMEYIWRKWFNLEQEKKENLLVATALIRKEDFWSVNGYELREKAVNEDWNFWLKLLAKGKKPVRMNFVGFWYRKKPVQESELYRSIQNKTRSMEIVSQTVKTINQPVKAIQYPKQDYDWDRIPDIVPSIIVPEYEKNDKIKILFILPWMTVGGADKFNLDLLEGLDKEKFEVTIVSTVPGQNEWRQKFTKQAEAVYDLTSFLDRKYWTCFIDYLIQKNQINLIFNTNSVFGYNALPYLKAKHPDIPIIDYVHMEEWYNRNGGYSRDSSAVASVIDKTYVCNKNSEKILVEHFGRKPEEVETVYIGVDETKFDKEKFNKQELLKKYAIPEGKKIISYIARIDLQKRPHLLIQIIKELQKKRDDVIFVVAGNGPLLSDIKEEAKKYKISDKMFFLGTISNTGEIYAISDMTINCSIKEGLALTAYESLAMGVPVVSADVGGQRELVTDEVGKIVPCLQKENEIKNFQYSEEEVQNYVVAIEEVLGNLDSYKANARNKILNGFTIRQMIEKMSTIFEKTAKEPNQEKIEAGRQLASHLAMTKELITKQLIVQKEEDKWLSDKYYIQNFESKDGVYRRLKEILWANPCYRFMIKFLKATGIMALIKKVHLDQKVKGLAKKVVK